jgi:hypothetical protein
MRVLRALINISAAIRTQWGVVMKPVSVTIIIAVGGMLSVAGPAPARADVVGNIQVCYFCNNNFGQGVQDGPIFELNNTLLQLR